jgi:hypothetical protein
MKIKKQNISLTRQGSKEYFEENQDFARLRSQNYFFLGKVSGYPLPHLDMQNGLYTTSLPAIMET